VKATLVASQKASGTSRSGPRIGRLWIAGLILGSNRRITIAREKPDGSHLGAPNQFISIGGYSRNTLAAVTRVWCVTVRGGSVSPASKRKASGNTL
jgi:hypothetical protein